jgi:TRAP-type C4-dicarboxylate transport system substrate-binding protein
MTRKIATTALALLFAASALSAAPVVIKIVNIIPEGSPWHAGLQKFANEAKKLTGGQVLFTIQNERRYSETEVVRRLSADRYDAASFTTIGLVAIYPEIALLSVPSLIRDQAEFEHVLDKTKPLFRSAFEERGLQLFVWCEIGWLRFFSKQEALEPAAMKKLKLGSDNEQVSLRLALQALGFNVVPISVGEILTGLSTGIIDSFYTTPILAALNQWFGLGRNMLDYRIAPTVGGIVLSKSAWERIPEQWRGPLLELAGSIERSINAEVEKKEADAIETMKKIASSPLKVHPVDAALAKRWNDDLSANIPKIIGSVFAEDVYKELRRIIDEYRKAKK